MKQILIDRYGSPEEVAGQVVEEGPPSLNSRSLL